MPVGPETIKKKRGRKRKDELEPDKSPDSILIANQDPKETCCRLICGVCNDLPKGNIMQCKNSHLMCLECYKKIMNSRKAICPQCRTKLNREEPIRNTFAEYVLGQMQVPCSNKGCTTTVLFSKLDQHVQKECSKRMSICKYADIGCQWEDIFASKGAHEETCSVKKSSVEDILSAVVKKNTQLRLDVQRHEDKWKNDAVVTTLLTKPCVDMTVNNVVLPASGKSGLFSLVGIEMIATLNKKKAPETLCLTLRCQRSVKRKTVIEIFILLSSEMGFQMPAFSGRFSFTSSRTRSEEIVLNLSKEQAVQLCSQSRVSLRICALDCTPGESMCQSFDSSHEENEERPTAIEEHESDDDEFYVEDDEDEHEEEGSGAEEEKQDNSDSDYA